MRRTAFQIDAFGPFEGLTLGEEWNGFAVPYFERAEAERIAAAWAAQPAAREGRYEAAYNASADAFRFYEPINGEELEYAAEEAGGLTLYPVGARDWTWEEV